MVVLAASIVSKTGKGANPCVVYWIYARVLCLDGLCSYSFIVLTDVSCSACLTAVCGHEPYTHRGFAGCLPQTSWEWQAAYLC